MKIRKLLAVFLVAALCVTMFACTKKDDSPSSSNTTTTDTSTNKTDEPAPKADEPAPKADEPAPVEPATEPAVETPADTTTATGQLPRNETLYIGGQQWDAVRGWNPYGADNNNALCVAGDASRRLLMFEGAYMYNILDGKLYPLIADGNYVWNGDKTELTFKIKSAAKWSDGSVITAYDYAYGWDTSVKYDLPGYSGFSDYVANVEAVDAQTVKITSVKNADGSPVNPFQLEDYLCRTLFIQKAWTETLEARSGGDAAKLQSDPGEDVVYSGPYHKFSSDDQRVVLIRDDNYWGKDASMWGKLPVPKYVAHNIYADNASQMTAFKAGEIDVNQQFIENVQNLWLVDNLPISTYMEEAPYGVCLVLPTMWFNVHKAGLDNVNVRKAIAMAVDYDQINANAMTGQSPTFAEVPRSLMNPTAGEQSKYDHAAVKNLQFAGKDIAGANKLLDDAGIVDSNGDGIRDIDGVNLSFNVVCPNGWSDWQAAVEIVAAAGAQIGVELTTYYPDWGVYQTVFTNPSQMEYDLMMWSAGNPGPTSPWSTVRQVMSSEWNNMANGNWNGNFGGYENAEADQLIKDILLAKTDAEVNALYTRAVELYLTDVPSFALMYRPSLFHAVYEGTWTSFPEAGDGKNVPPTCCTDGYGIAALYNLELAK